VLLGHDPLRVQELIARVVEPGRSSAVTGQEDRPLAAAAAELEGKGYRLLHGARTEPWGQTVARLIGPEGLLVGLSYAPWYHEAEPGAVTES